MLDIIIKAVVDYFSRPDVQRQLATQAVRALAHTYAQRVRNASYTEAKQQIAEMRTKDARLVRDVYGEFKDQMGPEARRAFEEELR